MQNDLYNFFLKSTKANIHKWHHYFDIYEKYFSAFRASKIVFLEIGVSKGGSLEMWSSYFHPDSIIIGIDIDPSCKRFESGNIRVEIGSQSDYKFLDYLVDKYGKFDIVLDDGCHISSKQIKSFERLYSNVKHLYVVEDTHTSYWLRFRGGATKSFIGFVKSRIDDLHYLYKKIKTLNKFNQFNNYPKLSEFNKTTIGIHIYDSIVVFEKGIHAYPIHELR